MSNLKKIRLPEYFGVLINTESVEQETLGAAAYLKLARENPTLIKSSHIAHPRAGKNEFGSFVVRYSRPIYKAVA